MLAAEAAMPLSALILLALSVNVPLGYLRSRSRRLSWPWFLWVHLSIPLLAACRILSHFGFIVVPWLVGAAVVGQVVGGKIRA
jgi:hypothetical protein